jgi:hypothetical protein
VEHGQGDEKFVQCFENLQGKRPKDDIGIVRHIVLNYVNINSYIDYKGVNWIEFGNENSISFTS